MDRRGLATLLAGLVVAVAPSAALAADRSAGPSPGPVTDPGTDQVITWWRPVNGLLGNGLPGFGIQTGYPVAAAGWYWAVERYAIAREPDSERSGFTIWHEPAVWRSSDGREWQRRRLPDAMRGAALRLLPWGDGAVIVAFRGSDDLGRSRYDMWRSQHGWRWRFAGHLAMPAARELPGCASADEVSEQGFVGVGDRLVVVAQCVRRVGTGGSVGPHERTIGLAATVSRSMAARVTGLPVWTWTTADGAHWARHRIRDPHGATRRGLSVVKAVGRGVGAITCCRPRQLLWSEDGVTFQEIARLPGVQLGIGMDITAIAGPDGRPLAWFLAAQASHDPALSGDVPAGHMAVWRLDGSVWRAMTDLGSRGRPAIAATGAQVVVVRAVDIDEDEGTVQLRTRASIDSGSTWHESPRPVGLSSSCQPGVAGIGNVVVLGCGEGDVTGLWAAHFGFWPATEG